MQLIKSVTTVLAGTCLAIGATSAAVAAPAPKISVPVLNHVQPAVGARSEHPIVHLAKRGGRQVGRRWRGHRRWHRGRRRWRRGYRGHRGARWIGPAIAGLIIGGAIASSKRDYRDRWERCDDRYKTFRWSDGTYIPYVNGPRRLCPYLRR
jgi:BA14K-like protein